MSWERMHRTVSGPPVQSTTTPWLPETYSMAYVEDRTIHDADSHIMEVSDGNQTPARSYLKVLPL